MSNDALSKTGGYEAVQHLMFFQNYLRRQLTPVVPPNQFHLHAWGYGPKPFPATHRGHPRDHPHPNLHLLVGCTASPLFKRDTSSRPWFLVLTHQHFPLHPLSLPTHPTQYLVGIFPSHSPLCLSRHSISDYLRFPAVRSKLPPHAFQRCPPRCASRTS